MQNESSPGENADYTFSGDRLTAVRAGGVFQNGLAFHERGGGLSAVDAGVGVIQPLSPLPPAFGAGHGHLLSPLREKAVSGLNI